MTSNISSAAEMQQHQQLASSAMSDIINNHMVGCIAHVTFRVRCETLGHGEEVFLIAITDHSNNTELPSTILHSGKVRTITFVESLEKGNNADLLFQVSTLTQ
jgi:hypothetical protein